MLTFLDPLAAVLLLARSRLGVILTVAIVAIVTSDVALNEWVGATLGFQVGAFVAQSLFRAFVLARARIMWPRRRFPGLFACTMTMGFPPAAKEP